MKKLPCLLLAPLAFVMAGGEAAATGSGGDSTFFEYRYHPDFPLDDFAAGRLGILRKSFRPRYLAVAYRVLKDRPLDEPTRKEVVRMWLHSFIEFDEPQKAESPADAWIAARKTIRGVGERPAANPYNDDALHDCLGDAYANATRTLKDRAQRFGASSEPVKAWVRAQDLVFATCEKAKPAPPLPDENVPPGPPILRHDRAYQIAAAHFYRGDWDVASEAFLKIAGDIESPWQPMGLYLSARALLRKGTAPEKPDLQPLLEAQARLERVAADPKLSAMHDRARRLHQFAAFRTDPKAVCGALASSVMADKGAVLAGEIFDFDLALARVDASECLAAAKGEGADLVDWIATLQQKVDETTTDGNLGVSATRKQHAVDRWKETKAMPWLVAALALAEAGESAEVGALLDAARKVKPASPAGLTLAYHRIRLLLDQKREPAARALLDERLADPALKPGMTALNRFRAQRLRLARDIHEFLSLAPRWQNGSGYDDAGQEFSPAISPAARPSALLDRDAAPVFFNILPLADSIAAARDPALPDEIRNPLLRIAWTRAVLLDEEKLALSVVESIAAADARVAAALRVYAAGKDPAEKRFLAAQAIIDTGIEFTPFPCAATYGELRLQDEEDVKPRFVTAEQTARAKAEKGRFDETAPVARWLADQLATWARAHKDQPRMDELLHRAVEATRHAHDERTGPASKRAYKALHDLYPQSPWTKKTKYWY